MARGLIGFAFAILVGALISSGNAQQESGGDSVADAARLQKQIKSEQKKPAEKKVYTNSDVVRPDAAAPSDTRTNPQTASSGSGAEGRGSSPLTDPPTRVKNQKNQNSGDGRSTPFDRPKPDLPDTIVVPGGTKIVVDISEENPPRNIQLRLHTGKVVNIVQVGSTVVIPALSKVTIQDSAGVMELTEVTLGSVRYKLQTDRVPLQEGSISEATFTVTKDFTIER